MDAWPPNTKFLVIVNYYDHDISWAQRLKFPHIVYYKDQPDKEPFNAVNRAKSETNLLKFVDEFYDRLPDHLIIVHQYEHKYYHRGSLVDLLNDPYFEFKYQRSLTPGFWNFNRPVLTSVKEHLGRMKESGWWSSTMEPFFGTIDEYGDFMLGKIGCAQFVVSRERIRALPREFYRQAYQWFITHTLDTPVPAYHPRDLTRLPSKFDSHSRSSYFMSRYLEWSWELIFTCCRCTPPSQILALYGYKRYQRDVTAQLLKYCLHSGVLIIMRTLPLNAILTDVVCYSPKTLRIWVHGREYTINEDRHEDVIITI